ncbi:uncharacterized protein LACBIDRAFT_293446 [Laccaria bicolor S238N-H82]|uniref:Predicted protein n=1 Tax=Laccaria bicolor (strain S238N-H82 / ATCC MYA-4686) TaxID=486041 RepID=B0D3M5_LACBS|nr:uncharacterized protein LACBIDRAFT_293446 [Laccaria bicolor S238N-H82]EDR10951.1 predicted protein [Laccaria bicolor S238N-H82]|eukprot:XP_001878252.1 predicted protein [Laccaria bicolor S238N-H82]
MTEYDYSPEAYERYLATQNRIARWVDGTLSVNPRNPFTPATPAGQPLVIQRELEEYDDDERTTESTVNIASTVEVIVIENRLGNKIENTGIPLLVPVIVHPLIRVILAPHTLALKLYHLLLLYIRLVIVSGRPPGIHAILPALLKLLVHALHLRLPTFHKINFHGINTHPLLLHYPNHAALTPTPPNNSTIRMRRINIIKPTQINQSSFLSTLTVGATHTTDPLISQTRHSSHIRHIRHNHLQNSLCWLGSFRGLQGNIGPRDGNAVATSNNLRPCSTSR